MYMNFYRVYLEYEGVETNDDVWSSFFLEILKFSHEKKLYKIKEYPISIENIKDTKGGRKALNFYKYRKNYKPYIESSPGIISPLNGDIVEVTTSIYDRSYSVLALQVHREGTSIKDIINYLNNFIQNEKYKLKFEFLYQNHTLNEILNQNNIKEIYPIFKDINSFAGIIEKSSCESLSSYLLKEENADIEICIKNNKKGGSFSGNLLKKLFEIDMNNDIIDYKITYKQKGKSYTRNIKELINPLTIEILKNKKNINWEAIYTELDESLEFNKAFLQVPNLISMNRNLINSNDSLMIMGTE